MVTSRAKRIEWISDQNDRCVIDGFIHYDGRSADSPLEINDMYYFNYLFKSMSSRPILSEFAWHVFNKNGEICEIRKNPYPDPAKYLIKLAASFRFRDLGGIGRISCAAKCFSELLRTM